MGQAFELEQPPTGTSTLFTLTMNFEGFKILIQRVAIEWWQLARKEIIELDSAVICDGNHPRKSRNAQEMATKLTVSSKIQTV